MTDDLWHSWYISTITTARIWREKSTTINSLSSSLWHNTSLKQQLSQSEDDYEILPFEICNYINSLSSSLWHNTSLKQRLGQSQDDYEFVVGDFKRKNLVVVVVLKQWTGVVENANSNSARVNSCSVGFSSGRYICYLPNWRSVFGKCCLKSWGFM